MSHALRPACGDRQRSPLLAGLAVHGRCAGCARRPKRKPRSVAFPRVQGAIPLGAHPSPFGLRPRSAAITRRDPIGAFFSWVVDTQQTMQRELTGGVKSLKTGNALAGAMTLAALSFIYGVVHAVGPGHGKTIISSYVVANEETVRRGVMVSFIAAAMQAMTAVALVSVLVFALKATGIRSMPGRTSWKARAMP